MHRRLAIAFSIVFSAAVLAACGDAGDHLGEFRQNSPVVSVTKLAIAMPIIASQFTRHGTFKLYVTAYGPGGQAATIGAALSSPIVVQSNYPGGVKFGSHGKTTLQFTAQPSPITVHYTAPEYPCAPPIAITAYSHDAQPQTVLMDMVACPSPSPSPSPTGSSGPTSSPSPTSSPTTSPTPTATPTPVAGTVKRLALALPATPNPLSPGTFPMVVTAFNSGGKAIPTGTALTNPIQLTSNSSCSIGFVSNGSTSSSLTLNSAPGSVTIAYSPPSATCTPPSMITITGFNLNASPQSSKVSILGGTATVTGLALSLINTPDPVSEGVYPIFVTATGSSGVIPYGVSLTNPIEFSSNASCAVSFGVTLNPGTYTTTYRMTSTQTQVYMQFNVGTCSPPASGIVTVQAIAAGAPTVKTQYQFPW